MNEWKRQIPTKAGYWLRVNAGHGVSMHRIDKRGRYLWIYWGGGGDGSGWMKSFQKQWKHKLDGWQWYGPIPEPKIERYSYQPKGG